MEGPPVCFLPYSHPHKVRAVQRETKGRCDSESEPHSLSTCSAYLRYVKPSSGVSCIFRVSTLQEAPRSRMQALSVPLRGVDTEVQSQVSLVTQLEPDEVKIQPQGCVCRACTCDSYFPGL